MNRRQICCFVMMLLLLGACTGMKEESINTNSENEQTIQAEPVSIEKETKLPDHRAIQDPYTRSFLVSTNEPEDGFYEMRTWTDAYSMYIPVDGKLDETFYQKRKDYWEQFWYSWNEEDANISYSLLGRFEVRTDSEENGLFHMSRYVRYEGDFEKSEDEKHIYHYAETVLEIGKEGQEMVPVYSYLALVKDKKIDKALALTYQHNCSDWTNTCNANTDEIKEHFWKIVKSVTFDE